MKALLGRKLGMTQLFADDALVPVTVIEAGPCYVTQVKTEEKEGYGAVQIGYAELKPKHVTKPLKGHFDKAKTKPSRYLAEYRLDKEEQAPEVGSSMACDIFAAGELADVTSVSKGKGFQGVMKRWGFAGGPGGHGSHFHRTPGSIGMAATPSRVFKGMKMAGRMGGDTVTVKNLEVIKVDVDQNVILVKGAVPGGKGALVLIKATGKVVQPTKLTQVGSEKEGKRKEKNKEEKPKETEVKEKEQEKEQQAEGHKKEAKE